jgi:opacity protein-like surface antigen
MRKAVVFVGLMVILSVGQATAENLNNRWQIGGGIGFVSTQDDIRSNAAFVDFANPGPDGIPDSGDETILFVDPRPDDTLSRETTIQETFNVSVGATYGISDSFSIQLEGSYFQGNVVQFDTFFIEVFPADTNNDGVLNSGEKSRRQSNIPFTAGTYTQVPISLSGVFRFRKDSPLNPYVGVGVGYVFNNVEDSKQFDELAQTLADAEIRSIGSNAGTGFIIGSGATMPPFEGLRMELDDGYEVHLVAGAEYFFTSSLSMYVDARYMFTGQDLKINVNGFDQLNFDITSLSDTLPECTNGPGDGDGINFDDPAQNIFGANGDGTVDKDDFSLASIFPESQGIPGLCRPGTGTREVDQILVQGGEINLSNITIGVGVRWAF